VGDLLERDLVARLKRGEPAAFDEAFDAYGSRLFSFLVRLSHRWEVAEDLLQETWLRLATRAPLLRDDTRLSAWLFTVARNGSAVHTDSSLAFDDSSCPAGRGGSSTAPTGEPQRGTAAPVSGRLRRGRIGRGS
jgi:hypothetical protein